MKGQDRIMGWKFVTAIAAAAVLAGCSTETAPESAVVSRPQSAEQALVASVGLNVPAAQGKVGKAGYNTAVNTGLAAGMAQDFGGFGLAGGILGVLASPGAGPEGSPHLLTELRAGDSVEAAQSRIARVIYKATGQDLGKAGYQEVRAAYNPTSVVFVQPGCGLTRRGYYDRACSKSFSASLHKPDGATKPGAGYLVNYSAATSIDHVTLMRRMVDLAPKELSLYLPPEKRNGTWLPARLYKNGKEIALQ